MHVCMQVESVAVAVGSRVSSFSPTDALCRTEMLGNVVPEREHVPTTAGTRKDSRTCSKVIVGYDTWQI